MKHRQLSIQVIEKHGIEFRESDVVTTFLAIAEWDHTTGNHEVLQSKPFQTLVGMLQFGSIYQSLVNLLESIAMQFV